MEHFCRWCGIQLHYREDYKGWKENDNPNCLKNPSDPKFGHMTNEMVGEK